VIELFAGQCYLGNTHPEIPMATTSLKLSEQLKARIASLAEEQGKSPHAYMVDALEQQAERAERRREFLAAGRASAEEFDRTGIGYAFEDVERYIVALAAGKKVPRPKPRKFPTKL
jgi:predicted transcriptional regulator